MEPHLEIWAQELERSRWSGWLLDGDLVLRYVSTEHRAYLSTGLQRPAEDDDIGIGLFIFEALTTPGWVATVDPDSMATLLPRQFGFWRNELSQEETERLIPEPLRPLLESAPEVETSGFISDRFTYTPAGQPPINAEFLVFVQRDKNGELVGVVCLNQNSIRPTLVTLLSRGDERTYERMADLHDPRRCQGAILFADLQGSARLSRMLATSTYFTLIRTLATALDEAVTHNNGVVGKHAGDGGSGFFLVGDDGSPSQAASAAIAAARHVSASARTAIGALEGDLDLSAHGMNIGVHWGSSIYMGQLVPGGRLEVTALGDPVNEAARIQEAACDGAILASKHLIEQLSPDDASAVGLDLDALTYRPLEDLPSSTTKGKRDAGSIPVTDIS